VLGCRLSEWLVAQSQTRLDPRTLAVAFIHAETHMNIYAVKYSTPMYQSTGHERVTLTSQPLGSLNAYTGEVQHNTIQ